jgi:hypothetical protein
LRIGTNMPAFSNDVRRDCGSTLSSEPKSHNAMRSCENPKEATSLPLPGVSKWLLAVRVGLFEAVGAVLEVTGVVAEELRLEGADRPDVSERVDRCSPALLRAFARSSKRVALSSWDVVGQSFNKWNPPHEEFKHGGGLFVVEVDGDRLLCGLLPAAVEGVDDLPFVEVLECGWLLVVDGTFDGMSEEYSPHSSWCSAREVTWAMNSTHLDFSEIWENSKSSCIRFWSGWGRSTPTMWRTATLGASLMTQERPLLRRRVV